MNLKKKVQGGDGVPGRAQKMEPIQGRGEWQRQRHRITAIERRRRRLRQRRRGRKIGDEKSNEKEVKIPLYFAS